MRRRTRLYMIIGLSDIRSKAGKKREKTILYVFCSDLTLITLLKVPYGGPNRKYKASTVLLIELSEYGPTL